MKFASFKKAIAPAVLAVLGVVTSWLVTGEFDRAELGITLGGLVTAVAVFAVPNVPSIPILKALVPSLLGLVSVGTSVLETGVFNATDLRTALAAVVMSAVVFMVKNEDQDPAPLPVEPA